MKKFLLKLALFFVALIVVDRALGMVFSYMGDHAKGGYIGHHKYITDKANEDILIFGSSRAIHHYNPQIISDSIGMSCYNCGQDGNGIILFYGLWQMIKQRHKPLMIIYDVTPGFDISEGESNQRYLGWLRADYDRPGVDEIFETVDSTEKIKMMSMAYRFNSKFMQNLTDYIHPLFKIEGNGFLPLVEEMDTMKIRQNDGKMIIPPSDKVKLAFVNKFIEDTKGIKLIFVVSPSWYGMNENEILPIKGICERNHIPFVDLSKSKKYIHRNRYFSDGYHLNDRGADEFTRDLVGIVKNY